MESATLNLPRPSRNGNLRAYLAGGGATAALVAGAVVVFLGVAAFVGFNGLPFGADESPAATVNIAAGVPEAAAAAAAPTAGAVAEDPATPSAAAIDEILASLPPGASGTTIPGLSETPGFGGNGPGGTIPPGTTPPGTTPGALGNTVGGLENTASDAGINLPLDDLTKGITQPVDKAVNDTLNGVGGALGDSQLGDKVTGAVNNTTNGLLGPGGLTDSLGLGKK
jgi:hypothetical protein